MLAGKQHASPRFLVTGSSGFLGASLVQMLARQQDALVLACDTETSFGTTCLAGVSHKLLDVRDREACMRVFREFAPTHVVHAAAVTVGEERLMLAVNLAGTENVMDAAMTVGSVERCLLLSSSGVYGSVQDHRPCDEEHPLDTRSTYAYTKRAAELCLPPREAKSGIAMVAARIGPCYGAQERVGTFRPRMSLPGTLRHALVHGETVRVYGGGHVRDWTHVEDIHRALIRLLVTPSLRHRMYNLSCGVAVSAREVVAAFTELGLRTQWVEAPSEATLVLRSEDSRKPMVIERLRSDTGFSPVYTLRQGIRTLLDGSLLPFPQPVSNRT
ncbi:MAG: NAD(P)-dependent oxidoreductase [Acidobacteriaceae bacterium]|nr:NAD(P)-dependent oxidoreductase [Acidobacteriaceae bacterium]